MKIHYLFGLTIAVSLVFSGCAQGKADGESLPQKDRVYTGMFYDDSHVLTVGYSGIVRRSVDGGKKWLGAQNSSMCLYGCDILDENTYIATGNKHDVIISKNAGESWVHMEDIGGSTAKGKSISFSDVRNGWISSKTWLGETVDGGKSWTEASLPQGVSNIETVCSPAPGTAYIIASSGELFQTTDGGKNWAKLTAPFTTDKSVLKPLFARDTQGIALRMHGEKGVAAVIAKNSKNQNSLLVSVTADGGETWSEPKARVLSRIPLSVSVSPKDVVSVFSMDTVVSRYKAL